MFVLGLELTSLYVCILFRKDVFRSMNECMCMFVCVIERDREVEREGERRREKERYRDIVFYILCITLSLLQ